MTAKLSPKYPSTYPAQHLQPYSRTPPLPINNISSANSRRTSSRVPNVSIRAVLKLLLLVCVCTSPLTWAEEAEPQAGNEVRINMQDTNIRSFIEWIAKATGKNFIIDPRVTGKVTVISNETMAPEEAY